MGSGAAADGPVHRLQAMQQQPPAVRRWRQRPPCSPWYTLLSSRIMRMYMLSETMLFNTDGAPNSTPACMQAHFLLLHGWIAGLEQNLLRCATADPGGWTEVRKGVLPQ